jgi:acetoacetyl-CoA reductase
MVMAIPKEVLDTKILPQIPLGRLGAPEENCGSYHLPMLGRGGVRDGRANIAINGGQHMQ